MKIDKVEQILGMEIFKTYAKKVLGDNPAFELVMQAITERMADDQLREQRNNSTEETNNVNINSKDSIKANWNFRPLTNGDISIKSQSSNEKSSNKIRIENAINKSSNKFGVDSRLVRAIIKQESDFNPYVVSSAGAMGLMQLMPENCKEDGVNDPFNIEENIEGGTKQLKTLLKMYNGNYEMALMGYNAGQGTVARRGVKSIDDLYKMPRETQDYVRKVMGYYNSL
ncbi:lytic transglycosylase domain-containing protein [Clostridium fallax]|uniref:Transglycosylase SLT domain-containing protein n=1 Tax=Clostridium fallax TaxID=1533 RepID=A0A1M4YX55_9CLOT|nr:lytic transglycosylase domain-containing protein [Clostridium fallax]SHF10404.1 Transglycosylase SLT domain-containing protein [Clostridium fallax]SQB22283.1 lytic murein transglycosylase [Clostridium fallax]